MRRWRHLARRTRTDQEAELSGRHLPQQGWDDEPVKWPDDRQIDSAKQVMRQYQRGRGDAQGMAGASDINHEAKIQLLVVKACNKAIGRLAHDRKYPDDIPGAGLVRCRRFRPSGATSKLRKASSTSIHLGVRASIFSAACRASRAAPS